MVERQIQTALVEGRLRGLEGEGTPLPDRSGDAGDIATGGAMRIMAEAEALPEAFKIKKLLEEAKRVWREA
ncbi:MAG: DnaJ family domain-containing protein [Pseudomonadota bacterium]